MYSREDLEISSRSLESKSVELSETQTDLENTKEEIMDLQKKVNKAEQKLCVLKENRKESSDSDEISATASFKLCLQVKLTQGVQRNQSISNFHFEQGSISRNRSNESSRTSREN